MVLADPDWVAADTGVERAGRKGLANRSRRLLMHLPDMHLPKVRLPDVRLPKE